MLSRLLSGNGLTYDWVSLDEISPYLPLAVVSSEDARFCSHNGVDWIELVNTGEAPVDLSGWLPKYPELKLSYSEGQIGWIPYILERADKVWDENRAWGGVADKIKEPPSTYYYRQIYGCFFDDVYGLENIEKCGIDNICFETDYPHSDSTWPHSKETGMKLMGNLPEDVVRKLVRGNAIEMLDLVRKVRRPDVHLSIVPRYFEIFTSNATFDDVGGVPLVSLPVPRLSRAARVLKRSFDLVVTSVALVVLAPVLLAIAIVVRLDSPGPVIYRQERRGRGGSVFRIAKFRSMHVGADRLRHEIVERNEVDGPLFKIKSGDPRVTRVGGFLRRTSLDELPQLWNVLRGEMSLVGPRPFVLHEADQITGWASRRLDLTPGVTGLWQVLGRNDLPFEEMVKLDYLYVTNWSLWWDVKIFCQTVPVVLRRKGAY